MYALMQSRPLATLVLLSSSRTLGTAIGGGSIASNNRTVVLQGLIALSSSSLPSSSLNNKNKRLDLHHVHDRVVISTQDEARRLLHERAVAASSSTAAGNSPMASKDDTNRCLAVVADYQSNGRGTQGRKWESLHDRKGNLFLTICVPYDKIPVMITLLPLQVAVLVARSVQTVLESCRRTAATDETQQQQSTAATADESKDQPKPNVTVKWPNDVLVNDLKISGTLIENEIVDGRTWLLIGIGLNVVYAPNLSDSPGKQVRAATSLQSFCNPHTILPSDAHVAIGTDLAQGLVNWMFLNDENENEMEDKQSRERKVVNDWKSFAQLGTKLYEIRGNTIQDETTGKYVGEKVLPIDIQNDGQLRVRGANGRERLLIADYMF